MSYWSFEQRVSDDDVIHYGRKGMKWGQNIFADDTISSTKTVSGSGNLKNNIVKKYGLSGEDALYYAYGDGRNRNGKVTDLSDFRLSANKINHYKRGGVGSHREFYEAANELLHTPGSGWEQTGIRGEYGGTPDEQELIKLIFGNAMNDGKPAFFYDDSIDQWVQIQYDKNLQRYIKTNYKYDESRDTTGGTKKSAKKKPISKKERYQRKVGDLMKKQMSEIRGR